MFTAGKRKKLKAARRDGAKAAKQTPFKNAKNIGRCGVTTLDTCAP